MITLPKEWILLNKLKQGDEIVLQIQNESITMYPKRRGKEVVGTIIKLHRSDKKFLTRFIYALYMLGLDEVVLEGEISNTLAGELSDIIHSLIGMEIIDLSENQIVLQCLTTHDLDITNVLKRMAQITSRIFNKLKACIEADNLEGIDEISKLGRDTDRLYFLAVRLENRMMREMQIPSSWDTLRFILGSRMVAKFVEEIVDLLKDFSKLLIYIQSDSKPLILENIAKLHKLFKKSFDTYLRSSDDTNIDEVEDVMEMIEDFQHEIDKIIRSISDPYLNLIFQIMLIISRQIEAIGEVAFNRSAREVSKENLRLLNRSMP
jgi:phosphate uptake regulator